MARRRFGADLTAVSWFLANDVDGVDDVVVLGREATGITAWDSRIDGNQVTDLTDLSGSPLVGGSISADEDGLIGFMGPDTNPETTELWLDAGLGSRQVAVASDLGPDVVAALSAAASAESTAASASAAAADAVSTADGAAQTANDALATSLAYTDAALADTPRYLLYDGGWPARPSDGRVTFFIGGEFPTDEPDDVNMIDGDMWFPASEAV